MKKYLAVLKIRKEYYINDSDDWNTIFKSKNVIAQNKKQLKSKIKEYIGIQTHNHSLIDNKLKNSIIKISWDKKIYKLCK
jgi:hypothetical protein